jgi:hypothetical protein
MTKNDLYYTWKVSLDLVFPKAQDTPTLLLKNRRDDAISGLILVELSGPKGRVGLWLHGVLRAAVPETSIDEYRDALRWENNVRSARNIASI